MSSRFSLKVMVALILPILSFVVAPSLRAGSIPADLSLPQLPEGIASFGAAVADGYLYVIGGHTGKSHVHSTENLNGSFWRISLQDPQQWEELPGGVMRQSVALVAHDGDLYRVGGLTARNARGEDEDLYSSDEIARFDPANKSWTALAPMPEPRSSHDAAVVDGVLYVAGGWQKRGKDQEALWPHSAYRMDLKGGQFTWEPIPAAPFQSRALAAASAGGKLYVLGGFTPDSKASKNVYIFDPATDTWSQGPELPFPGFGVSAFGVEDTVYVSGSGAKLYRLIDGQNKWEHLRDTDQKRFFHRLIALDEHLLVAIAGAVGGQPHLQSSETLGVWSAGVSLNSWELPFPGKAKNRSGMLLYDDLLYVFGGNTSLEQHDFEPERFVNDGYVVDMELQEVYAASDFPVNRQSMRTFIPRHGNTVGYAFGGFGHNGEDAVTQNEIFRYDLEEESWDKLDTRLPAPLTQFGMAEYDDVIWIFGGMDFDPKRGRRKQFQLVTDVYRWNPHSQQSFVKTAHELPGKRRAFAGARLGDRFYMVGGMKDNFGMVNDCDVFNFRTKQWETIPAPEKPYISPQMVALKGKLYMACGSTVDSAGEFVPNPSVQVYDPDTQDWSYLIKRLPQPMRHTQLFVRDGKLLLVSAHLPDRQAIRFTEIAVE